MEKLKYLLRYWNTIKYLKLIQIFSRLKILIFKRSISFEKPTYKRNNNFILIDTIDKKENINVQYEFNFLNKIGNLNKIGWIDNSFSKLWRYNQNYFDDLNSHNAKDKIELHKRILTSWINENKDVSSVAWDPYPTSLRIVNIIKWIHKQSISLNVIERSLAIQCEFLFNNIEYNIMGNHLLTNSKALIFGGIFFEDNKSRKWLHKGLSIIKKEISEQILDDGGHYENSPMYHNLILEDMIDLVNLISNNKSKLTLEEETILDDLKTQIKKMIEWAVYMAHPDGNISFFNDSTFEISSNLKDIIKYAVNLKIINNKDILELWKRKNARFYLNHFKNTGYIVSSFNDAYLIADVGMVGPDYIPSHAHADTLSFELSIFGSRVIVNSGISTYEDNETRKYERGTSAHNTVVVEDKNSSEVWSSFRVGNRARAKVLKTAEKSSCISVKSQHDGYNSIMQKKIHSREWVLKKNSLLIYDKIIGKQKTNGQSILILHPNIKIVSFNNDSYILEDKNNKKIVIDILKGISKNNETFYSLQFGKREKTKCISIDLMNNESKISISW